MKRRLCAVGLIGLLSATLLLSGCGGGPERFSVTFVDTFDTAVTLIAYDTDAEAFRTKSEQVHEKLREYDRLYDIYTPSADRNTLYTINERAGESAVTVGEEILDLLTFGQEVYDRTDGAVNVAAGAVLSLWHTARTAGLADPEHAALPDAAALCEAAKHIDMADLVIDREAKTVFLADAQMRLDVGAIAKGFATEQVARYAATLWDHAAISAGGNIRVLGGRADGSPWTVGVENPDRETADYVVTVGMTDGSLVTSGDYQRYYTVDGKKYHHLIDLESGLPASYFRSTTVFCADSGLADALSTALFLMPLSEGRTLVDSLAGVEALWVLENGETVMTDGMTEMRNDQ